MKLYRDICSAWISHTSAEFFHIDWCHKCLKNIIALLLFHGEHFYGFSESDYENVKKIIHFATKISIYSYTGNRYFWSFMTFFCTYCKGNYAYILPYILKTLPTLGNEKEK